MSLEIPNAIAAAATILFDPAQPLGSRFALRGSNGILSLNPEFVFLTVNTAVALNLETPVTRDEGCVLTALSITIGGTEAAAPYTKIIGADDASSDAPLNSLMASVASVSPKFIASIAVLRLPRP
jgi:hypothetical protein